MLLNGRVHVRIEESDLVNGGSLKKYGLLAKVESSNESTEGSKHPTKFEIAVIIFAIVSICIGIGCISAYAHYNRIQEYQKPTEDELTQRHSLLICASVFGSIGLGIFIVSNLVRR
jgi:nitrate/nitrite transporter NarK